MQGLKSVSALPWCQNHKGRLYSFEEYLEQIKSFHGHVAPGVVIGGKMTDMALTSLPQGILFDAICETGNCLPDAIQLLTPCTVGNGWLKIVPLARFGLALYDKYEGRGIRIALDTEKLKTWSEISAWFFKLKPKSEQNSVLLMEQIREAGDDLFQKQEVEIAL